MKSYNVFADIHHLPNYFALHSSHHKSSYWRNTSNYWIRKLIHNLKIGLVTPMIIIVLSYSLSLSGSIVRIIIFVVKLWDFNKYIFIWFLINCLYLDCRKIHCGKHHFKGWLSIVFVNLYLRILNQIVSWAFVLF